MSRTSIFLLAATVVLSIEAAAVTPTLAASIGGMRPGGWVSLNPQPLPPRYLSGPSTLRPGDRVSLNPQPLPPRILRGGAGWSR